MSQESRDPVTRSDFIKLSGRGFSRALGEVFGAILGSVPDSLEKAAALNERRVASEYELAPAPRAFYAAGRPVFAWMAGETPLAFWGQCPVDGGILSWQQHLGRFFCPACHTAFDQAGEALMDGQSARLVPVGVSIRKGGVWVRGG